MIRSFAACLMSPMLAGSAAAECMTALQEASAEGRLTRVRFFDLVGQPEVTLILELRMPDCMTGTNEYDKVESTNRIHVYSTNRAVARRLSGAVGKAVRVTGKPFGEMTVHHHAPIVMDVSTMSVR